MDGRTEAHQEAPGDEHADRLAHQIVRIDNENKRDDGETCPPASARGRRLAIVPGVGDAANRRARSPRQKQTPKQSSVGPRTRLLKRRKIVYRCDTTRERPKFCGCWTIPRGDN